MVKAITGESESEPEGGGNVATLAEQLNREAKEGR